MDAHGPRPYKQAAVDGQCCRQHGGWQRSGPLADTSAKCIKCGHPDRPYVSPGIYRPSLVRGDAMCWEGQL